jgi:hypothetical protein
MIFCKKCFCSVFELIWLRNTRKRDKTKKKIEETDIETFADFFGKPFDMDFLVFFTKNMLWCFSTPFAFTEKRPKSLLFCNQGEKQVGWWVGGSGI